MKTLLAALLAACLPLAGGAAAAEAQSSDKCPDCLGKGAPKCTACDGTGRTVKCKKCNGTRMRTRPDGTTEKCQSCIIEPCENCRGNGLAPCPPCKGKGALPCQTCQGTGAIDCGACGNKGRIRCPSHVNGTFSGDYLYICGTCNDRGTVACTKCDGKLRAGRPGTCTRCAGTGKSKEACPACKGSRVDLCKRCNGKGTLPSGGGRAR